MAALSLAPLALAAVLVLSGVAKLRDRGATASMVQALRLPRWVPPTTVGWALPWVELTTAALLLTPWRWTYALGCGSAVALFGAFLAVVVRAMGLDPRPVCACFGRVGNHRITGRTVARNTVLVGLALVAGWLAVTGSTTVGLVTGYAWSDAVWLALALTLAVLGVLAGGGASPDRVRSATPPRSSVLGSLLVDAELDTIPLLSLTLARPQLLVLVSCWCGSTFAVLERLPGWRERAPDLGVHLVHTQPPWSEPRVGGLEDVWWDPGARLFTAVGAGTGPTAVLVGSEGMLGTPATGVEEIERLLDYSASRSWTT
ncbi:MauE/DoxX family redox-associated membrane protein [Serinicoccus kebangsaanensis]|uniref:MauE/DoxX family redox-associated membrane protein n=1 Tax=Serinicoccus kebangsaanensis TaxID=2602069 RepID=UPI00124ECC31|nr:MauE/DoxX family redox-associated membrane protein [Serinicoccus kebangsaanensis]